MADFKTSYQKTSLVEGGYTADPNDNGNWTGGKVNVGNLVGTNYGITAPDMQLFLGRVPTVEDMKNMSLETRGSIYKNNYWDKLNLDFINDQKMANELYDTGVNMGIGTAAKFFQRVLNVSTKSNLTIDGKIGSQTIGIFNQLAGKDKDMVWKLFNCLQGERYISICEGNPTQERFLRSWSNRVFED